MSSSPKDTASKLALVNYVSRIVYGIHSSASLEMRKKIILLNTIARHALEGAAAPTTEEVTDEIASSDGDGSESDSRYEADGEWDGVHSCDRLPDSGDEWMADAEDKGQEDPVGEQEETSGKQQRDNAEEQQGDTVEEQQAKNDEEQGNALEEPDYSAGITDTDGWVFIFSDVSDVLAVSDDTYYRALDYGSENEYYAGYGALDSDA